MQTVLGPHNRCKAEGGHTLLSSSLTHSPTHFHPNNCWVDIYCKQRLLDWVRCKQKPILQAQRALVLPLMQKNKTNSTERSAPKSKSQRGPVWTDSSEYSWRWNFHSSLSPFPLLLNLTVPEIMPKMLSVCSMNKSEYTCLILTGIGNIIKTGLLQLGSGQQDSKTLQTGEETKPR